MWSKIVKLSVVLLVFSTSAFALNIPAEGKVSLTPEIGYVVLTDPASDKLEDSIAFGITPGFRLMKNLRIEVPILASFHDGKDLPEGEDAEMTMVSFTPGLAVGTDGKLRLWFFWGAGGTLVNSKFERKNGAVAESSSMVFATNLRGGLEYFVMEKVSAGFSLGVMTAAVEEEQLNGSKDWKTNEYYTMTLRVGYTF